MSYKYTISFAEDIWCTYESEQPQKWISLATELLQEEYQHFQAKDASEAAIFKQLLVEKQLELIDVTHQVLALEHQVEVIKQELQQQQELTTKLQEELEQQQDLRLQQLQNKVQANLQKAKEHGNNQLIKVMQDSLNEINTEKIKRKQR